jgi:hypothetical protein
VTKKEFVMFQEEMEENGESEKYEEKNPAGGELVNGKSVDEESSPNSNITNNNNLLHRSRVSFIFISGTVI